MERTAVHSSSIVSIGYDSVSSVLEVEFTGREVYQYTGVPATLYDGIMKAESHGKYLNAFIKGKYQYREI